MFRRILCTICSQGCPMFRQFPVHCTVLHHRSTPTALLWATTLFLLLPDCTSEKPVFSNFWIIFNRPCTIIGPTPFFIPLSVRNFYRATGTQSLFLYKSFTSRKKLYKQIAVLQWDSHGELLRHEMKKSHVPAVFITSETSCAHDMYFNLHILTFTAPSVAKY